MSDGFDRKLGRAFTFDAEDLEANRRGRLSANQSLMFANAVRIGARRERRVLPIVGILLLAVAGTAVAESGAALVPVAVVGVMSTFMVVLVLGFRRRDLASRRAMTAGVVETIEGPWELDTSLDGTWRVRVAGRLIGADLLAVQSLADGREYRFYVLKQDGLLAALSVERTR